MHTSGVPGSADSTYALLLHVGTHAELADRYRTALAARLGDLVPPTRQLLLATRQYLYPLLPALWDEEGWTRWWRAWPWGLSGSWWLPA